MAVTEEVMAIIRILDEEGLGELAGDLLFEINAGRVGEEPSEETADDFVTNIPFAPEEQLSEAVRILSLRLVEPARRLAEAERIAGQVADRGPVAIRFVDREGRERGGSDLRAAPGDQRMADDLEGLLKRIEAARPHP